MMTSHENLSEIDISTYDPEQGNNLNAPSREGKNANALARLVSRFFNPFSHHLYESVRSWLPNWSLNAKQEEQKTSEKPRNGRKKFIRMQRQRGEYQSFNNTEILEDSDDTDISDECENFNEMTNINAKGLSASFINIPDLIHFGHAQHMTVSEEEDDEWEYEKYILPDWDINFQPGMEKTGYVFPLNKNHRKKVHIPILYPSCGYPRPPRDDFKNPDKEIDVKIETKVSDFEDGKENLKKFEAREKVKDNNSTKSEELVIKQVKYLPATKLNYPSISTGCLRESLQCSRYKNGRKPGE